MKCRTIALSVTLVIVAVLAVGVIWLLHDANQRTQSIVSTSRQSYIDLQTRGVGTYFVELTQTKLASP